MDESRRIQKVGYNSLSVSIPKRYTKEMGLKAGDTIVFREDSDGTLRLIPASRARQVSTAILRSDQAGSVEMLNELVIGAYTLGYDTVEVVGKGPLDRAVVNGVFAAVRRLRGMEVVESDEHRVVAQSFMDPTKFPVDPLVKRLQILVSRSLENVMHSLDLGQTGSLNEVARIQEEISELYWLILRQLLVGLNRRDLAAEIGIESPLHAAGDRMSAKILDEIGGIIKDMAEELARLRGLVTKIDPEVTARIKRLAEKTAETFNVTVESLLAPDARLIGKSLALVDETMRLERQVTDEMLASGGPGYARVLVSYFGQLARYCNIITEISSHRLLRKTSRVATVQR